jgi:hypothetical protein
MVASSQPENKPDVNSQAHDGAGDYWRQRLADGEACHAAAQDYLTLGWSVTWCCPPDHVGVPKDHAGQCTHPGKAPLHRWKHLQTSLPTRADVDGWFRVWRNGNVGMALGRGSKMVRLDLEGPQAEVRLLELSGGELPQTLEFNSGREDGTGRGLLYAIPTGLEVRTEIQGLALGGELRIQGEGGQTVLPPSRHKSGSLYAWRSGRGPNDIAAAAAPEWLLKILVQPRRRRKTAGGDPAGDAYRDPSAPVEEGKRHTYLIRLAGLLRGRAEASVETIRAAVLAANKNDCASPIPEAEAEGIIAAASGWQQGPRDLGSGPDPGEAAGIIRAYWSERHEPPFRRDGAIYSRLERRYLRPGELLKGAPSDLIALLAAATDAKKLNDLPDRSALPALFRKWAPTAEQDLLNELDDEAETTGADGFVESAEEEFRRQLSAALLTLHVLGKHTHNGKHAIEETVTERRTVIEWAEQFATSARWSDVRSLCVWSCRGKDREVRVAIRAELFAQIHAPELSRITPERLAKLANLYGLGSACKVAGGDKRAIELETSFVRELLNRGCPDPGNREPRQTADGQADGRTGRPTTSPA